MRFISPHKPITARHEFFYPQSLSHFSVAVSWQMMSEQTNEQKRCSLWRRRRFENPQALQSVNHNRFQITRAMQLNFYWFLPELFWHMSFNCMAFVLNSTAIDLRRQSIRFDISFSSLLVATRRKMKRRWRDLIASSSHTHTGLCNFTIQSFGRHGGHPLKSKNVNRLSPEIENYSFCSFDTKNIWNDLCNSCAVVEYECVCLQTFSYLMTLFIFSSFLNFFVLCAHVQQE